MPDAIPGWLLWLGAINLLVGLVIVAIIERAEGQSLGRARIPLALIGFPLLVVNLLREGARRWLTD